LSRCVYSRYIDDRDTRNSISVLGRNDNYSEILKFVNRIRPMKPASNAAQFLKYCSRLQYLFRYLFSGISVHSVNTIATDRNTGCNSQCTLQYTQPYVFELQKDKRPIGNDRWINSENGFVGIINFQSVPMIISSHLSM